MEFGKSISVSVLSEEVTVDANFSVKEKELEYKYFYTHFNRCKKCWHYVGMWTKKFIFTRAFLGFSIVLKKASV